MGHLRHAHGAPEACTWGTSGMHMGHLRHAHGAPEAFTLSTTRLPPLHAPSAPPAWRLVRPLAAPQQEHIFEPRAPMTARLMGQYDTGLMGQHSLA